MRLETWQAKAPAPHLTTYWAVVGIGGVLLAAAGMTYSGMKAIPPGIAIPLLAAFLVEFSFYLLPAFPELLRMSRLRTVAFLTLSSVLPYIVYSLPAGLFDARNLLQLSAIALVVSLIYARGRVNGARDALFIVMIAALVLYRFFDRIYLSPVAKLQVSILGHLMLIRTAALSILRLRGEVKARFWFIPSMAEWQTGLKWFAISVAPLALAGWASGAIRLRDSPLNPLTGAATFVGILWVVALSEEFFFRGLIQQWIEDWTANGYVALIFASVLFGSVHLGFHGAFPNWRFSFVAAVLGLFCGLCWREQRSIQASMVTHAVAATAFRVFFQ